MKIERFLCGMFGDGKIYLLKTDGLNDVLTDKNFQYLRNLTLEYSDKYLWLPTEQVVALPHIENVEDDNGRTWVQNQTLLIPIHDYLQLTNPHQLLSKYFLPLLKEPPESLESLKVETK
jgi:hypothetical protein